MSVEELKEELAIELDSMEIVAMRDRGRRGGELVFLQILILMGDWCSQG